MLHRAVPSIIYTEDEEIRASTADALATMGTIDAVRQMYQDRWRVNMAGRGLTGIATLPMYESPILSSWQPALVPLD